MSPQLEKDLELLLQHSQEDQQSLAQFRMLREWLRHADPALEFQLEESGDRIRKGVMSAIDLLDEERPRSSASLTLAPQNS